MNLRFLILVAMAAIPVFGQTVIDDSIGAVGTAGAGFFHVVNQSATPATPTAAVRYYSTAANLPSWVNASGSVFNFVGSQAGAVAGINSIYSATGASLTLGTLDSNAPLYLNPHGTGGVNISGGTAGLYLGGSSGANRARIYTSANAANANLILAPDGSGWTQLLGTQTIKFGGTALANIGVSADSTTAALNINGPSGGYVNLNSKVYSGYPGRTSTIVLAVTTQPESDNGSGGLGSASFRFPSLFLGPSGIKIGNGTNGPTITATGTSPNEGLVLTPAGTGGVAIGATSPVKGIRTNTATLDFGTILAAANADLTITVTGAAVGDTVSLGIPATVASGAIFNGWVSAADTVTVRCNNAGSISIDPASATYRATVTTF